MKANTLVEFMRHVQPEPNTGCWLWTAARQVEGYGRIRWRGSQKKAHRIAYELFVGPITAESLDHQCRQPCCVNPRHLRPMSIGDNVLLGSGPAAKNARKTHCKRGHEFTAANTYVHTNGKWRSCWTCMRTAQREYRARTSERRTA